jgi:DNA-directed RNA polymerase subunit M/transcription elongation factor TFIIS
MKCENCGNDVREGARFCPKCGSSLLEQQQKSAENMVSADGISEDGQDEKNFHFEKVKMIGRLRYKIIKTEVKISGEKVGIRQNIHRFLRKEKEDHINLKLSEINSMEVKTKMDFWDTLYAAIFGVMYLMDITDVVWLLLIAVFLYTGYGKILNLKMNNGMNYEIAVNGMSEDVEQFQKVIALKG